MTVTKRRQAPPYFECTQDVEVEITIDPDDLHRDGWHHESECDTECKHEPAVMQHPLTFERVTHVAAIASLHRQAHPGQRPDPYMCPEEPCRSLTYQQLHEVTP